MAAMVVASRPSLTLTTHSASGRRSVSGRSQLPGIPPVVSGRTFSDADDPGDPPTPEHAPTFALGFAAPHAVIDPLVQCVLQAGLGHRALGADSLGRLHPHSVAREEDGRGKVLALPQVHPLGVHGSSVHSGLPWFGPGRAARWLIRRHPVHVPVSRPGAGTPTFCADLEPILTLFLLR